MPPIAFLECSRCHHHLSAATPQTVCPACASSLYVRYDLEELKHRATRPACSAADSMWRYASVLPDAEPVTLGEGWTPMLPSRRYPGLYIKEEADNPTGSFKARGMSMAV
ncbi:MAG: threonine synthase, partial [Acidobacteriaceae bacterium]